MTTNTDRVRDALTSAVTYSFEMFAFLDTTPVGRSSSTVSSHLTCWSWVKITEPWVSTVVLALPSDLVGMIGQAILGHRPEPGAREFADSQAELTNILAGRLVHDVMGGNTRIGLGLPRTGRGAPNVKEPGWLIQEFRIGEHHFAAFVHGTCLAEESITGTTLPGRSTALDVTIDGFQPAPAAAAAASVPAAPGVPASLAGYQIASRLGEGGMGVVYKATHTTLNRQVALKVMRPELAQNQRFVARFLREARTAASIDHPNVVTVYDAGVHEGFLYIAMRYVAGGDLAQAVKDRGPMPAVDALVVIGRCLLGLQAIHEGGLVHRDIKPANILLEVDGMPRLADLGLARGIELDDQLSQVGSVQGTPAYMSPEQARGGHQLDGRSDIYSLGATLYALLTGEPPFQGESAYDTVAQVLYNEPKPLATYVQGIHPAVETLVMRTLAKDPAARPQTASEFIEAIDRLLTVLGSSAKPAAASQLRTPLPGHLPTASGRLNSKTRSGEHWLARWLKGKSGA